MMAQDIRWMQRFKNFEKAFQFLETATQKQEYDPLQQAGLVQSFEFTFELAWKTLKDYLQQMGVSTAYPRQVLKESFQSGLIQDGHLWIKMLDKRNELSHTYNEEQAEKAVEIICTEYFPAVKQVYVSLKEAYDQSCSD